MQTADEVARRSAGIFADCGTCPRVVAERFDAAGEHAVRSWRGQTAAHRNIPSGVASVRPRHGKRKISADEPPPLPPDASCAVIGRSFPASERRARSYQRRPLHGGYVAARYAAWPHPAFADAACPGARSRCGRSSAPSGVRTIATVSALTIQRQRPCAISALPWPLSRPISIAVAEERSSDPRRFPSAAFCRRNTAARESTRPRSTTARPHPRPPVRFPAAADLPLNGDVRRLHRS